MIRLSIEQRHHPRATDGWHHAATDALDNGGTTVDALGATATRSDAVR